MTVVFLERLSGILNRALAAVAGCALVAMMLVTVGEMALRLWGSPMAGTVEVVSWLAAVTTALALGYTQLHSGHVSINLFVARLPPRLRAAIDAATALVAVALFAVVSWHVFRYAGILQRTGSLSQTLKVIVYPWVYLAAAGCTSLTLALVVDCLRSLGKAFGRGPGAPADESGERR